MADKNTENENGDDLGYGSQRKNIMDEGKEADKNTNEMNTHENWTRKSNRTGMITGTKEELSY
jgi:gamma-glutamyl:cysteine ligase YbdK (ATP-grasp superfamily)